MQAELPTNTIQYFILQLINIVQAQIDLKDFLKNLPFYSASQCIGLLSEINYIELIPSPTDKTFSQQSIASITKIEKDSLMPKDLSQEKVRVESPRVRSPKSSASSMRKLVFTKRESSNLVEKLQSVSFSDKKQTKRQSKKIDNSVYQPLQLQQDKEETSIKAFRQKTQARLVYNQRQNRLKQERQKCFQSKLNQLNHILKEHPKAAVAYDYEGDPLKSNTEDYQNLKVNMTRTGISFASKKLKEGVRLIDPEESKIQIRQKASKSTRQQVTTNLKPLQLPLFPMKFIDGQQAKNLKLEEYRKFYGRKYNRLDQINHTIDMNATTKTIQDVPFEKKHSNVNDKNNEEQNIMKGRDTQRKLALPKLNGKYKVLDRYE